MKIKKLVRELVVGCGIFALTLTSLSVQKPTTVQASETSIPVYRVYNPNTGEHLYTISAAERDNCVRVGWNNEGIGWYTSPYTGAPVYRVYNPNASGGDHYYTMNQYEATSLVSKGWKWDNNGAPVFYSYGDTNLYVAYNPNASSGSHNYTVNTNEQNNLLSHGWTFGAVAWHVMTRQQSYTCSVAVDCNVTGDGGTESQKSGTYRLLYSDLPYNASATSATPEIDFSADITLHGSGTDYEVQFIVAGTSSGSGQVGAELHYQAGSDARYAQGRINCTNINFRADAGSYGQQYYSVNTSAPSVANNETVKMEVKYYASGYFEAYVKGTLIGRYSTKLVPASGTSTSSNDYILHIYSNTSCSVSNIKVLKKGTDITSRSIGFGSTSYSLNNSLCQGIY